VLIGLANMPGLFASTTRPVWQHQDDAKEAAAANVALHTIGNMQQLDIRLWVSVATNPGYGIWSAACLCLQHA
jgi:hypothetical protein